MATLATLRNRIQTLHGFTIVSKHIFIYTIELDVNLLHFDSRYPKNLRTFGERLRKARMDKGLQIKELAKIIGITPDSVINWEIRNIKPREKHMAKLMEFITE